MLSHAAARASEITKEQIDQLVAAWYRALDNHDPFEDLHSSKNPSGLEIVVYNAQVEPFQAAPGWARF